MAEPFSEIEKSLTAKASLEERLREYPELKAKMERLLGIIENAGGDIEKAAEAERRIIEELRQMGNEVLHGWARRQQHKKSRSTTPSRASIGRKKKPLLVYPTGKNRNRGADLHPRSSWAGDSTVFRIGGSGVPQVFGSPTTSHHRFGCR